LKIVAIVAALICFSGMASSQAIETVLYSFHGYPTDGTGPSGTLLFANGRVYGVTGAGGKYCFEERGCGTVYELSPTSSGEWSEKLLYEFCSTGNPKTCADGATPYAGLIMDPSGNLYGTATAGGTAGIGVVFRLSPPLEQGGSWTETVLWNFSLDLTNGRGFSYGALNIDTAGNLYGTTTNGGSKNAGIVYELSPQPDGRYSFSILHNFSGPDGADPEYGVTFDSMGNLYGTTSQGGRGKSICSYGCGLVYELSPIGSTWSEAVLFEFDGVIGAWPISPISIDGSGNLYGTFEKGGGETTCYFITCGGVFKLVPGSNRKYVFDFNSGADEGTPHSGVTIGSDGTLYGTEGILGFGEGQAYMLQGSHETVLYNFCSAANCSDGLWPAYGNLIIHNGSLFGATAEGGSFNDGVVYSLTQ